MTKLPIKHSAYHWSDDLWSLVVPLGVMVLVVVFAVFLNGCGHKATKVLAPTCCEQDCSPDEDDDGCPHDDDVKRPGAIPLPPSFAPPSVQPARPSLRSPAKAAPSPAS